MPLAPQQVSIVHRVHHRVRLRVAALYRSEPLKLALERSLTPFAGVQRVTISVTTTSVLIVHNGEVEVRQLVERVHAVVRAPESWPEDRAPQRAPNRSIWSKLTARWNRRDETSGAAAVACPSWHAFPVERVRTLLGTHDRLGLTNTAAEERLHAFGPNTVPAPPPRPILRLLVDQLQSLPVLLLCGSALLSAVTGGLADAAIILLVVAGNAAIAMTMELQAERTIGRIVELAEPVALVTREGTTREVSAGDIVPGDLLVVARGSRVAADARLIISIGLSVDESMLTGESAPVDKTALHTFAESTPVADRRNMVYRGTIVTGGSGRAFVTETGVNTEVGRLQTLAFGAGRPETPLETQLGRLGTELVAVAVGASGLVFLVGLLRGYAVIGMLKTAVSLALAAIPEGLPAVATTALASGVNTLGGRRILVRRLRAMEVLGTVDIVCLDKTGTLTINQMSVVDIVAGLKRHRLSDGGFQSRDPDVTTLLRYAALCTAGPEQGNGSSSTESALLNAAAASGLDLQELTHEHPLLQVRQRTEARNVMMTLHASRSGGAFLAIKGNPLEVLEQCAWHWVDGRQEAILGVRDRIVRENDRLARMGERVLGVAFADTPSDISEEAPKATWLGLIGMIDPLRATAAPLVRVLREASVVPAILTGDQGATAAAIARQLDVTSEHVHARVSPGDKLRIVRSYQSVGHVVAMTGDGVNDSPALRAADIGIAMGQSGTRIARDVADVLLLDDDIRGIMDAIAEGRRVHTNIRKAVHYIMASNLSELLVMLGSISFGMGQPLNPRQLLWINLLTDVLPEIALALEPVDEAIRRTALDPRAPVVSRREYRRLGFRGFCIAAPVLGAYAASARSGASRSSGVAFVSLTAAQLFHALAGRSRHDGAIGSSSLLPAVAAGFGVMGGGVLLPPLRGVLGMGRVRGADMLLALGAAAVSALTAGIARGSEPGGRHGSVRR